LFIKELGTEDTQAEAVTDPDWAEIETAIKQLDGKKFTLVTLNVGDEVPSMTIGGGANGIYVVHVTFDNSAFYSLLNPSGTERKISLIVGAQRGEFEEKECVSLDMVLRVAKHFYETGQMDKNLSWDKD
jgi:hypothetical protein